MPSRLRLFDLRNSDLPELIGSCSSDLPRIRNAVNRAQERLIFASESGDEGWNGSWGEMQFAVSRDNPYLTLPREVARLEKLTLCNRPIDVHAMPFEYLKFGNGRMAQCNYWRNCQMPQAYARNNAITFTDLTNAPQRIAVYFSDPADNGRRVLIQGTDNNGNTIYSQDGLFQVSGEYVVLAPPFVMTTAQVGSITGIQKDVTSGPIQIFQVDPATAAQTLLLTMQAGEEVASYRRYFFNPLQFACCPTAGQTTPSPLNVTALVKFEPIPVVADADYLLLTCREAIIAEAQAIRYEGIDTPTAKSMMVFHHKAAIRYLNAELSHVNGLNLPDAQVKVFGSARLERQKIGLLR